jgi:hypothetical protein
MTLEHVCRSLIQFSDPEARRGDRPGIGGAAPSTINTFPGKGNADRALVYYSAGLRFAF